MVRICSAGLTGGRIERQGWRGHGSEEEGADQVT